MGDRTGIVTVSGTEDVQRLVGRELGPSDWVQVTQDDVDAFGRAAHDWHWAHNDPDRAARGPFGSAIAHAHLTLSTIPHLRESLLSFDRGEAMFYGYNRVRFPAPVPVGARIRMHAVVVAVDPIELGEQVTMDVSIEVEGQERPACVAQALWRHYDLEPPADGP